jgi:hypothetical protein
MEAYPFAPTCTSRDFCKGVHCSAEHGSSSPLATVGPGRCGLLEPQLESGLVHDGNPFHPARFYVWLAKLVMRTMPIQALRETRTLPFDRLDRNLILLGHLEARTFAN